MLHESVTNVSAQVPVEPVVEGVDVGADQAQRTCEHHKAGDLDPLEVGDKLGNCLELLISVNVSVQIELPVLVPQQGVVAG